MGWQGGFYGGDPIGMFIGMIVLMVVLVAVAFLAVTVLRDPRRSGSGASPTRSDEAKSILDRRFAQGDLTKEEYSEALGVLGYGSKSRDSK